MKTDVYAPGVPSAVSGSGSGFEPADALAPKTSSPARPRAPSLIANLPVRAPARTRSQSADSAFVRRASLPAEPQSGDAAALRCASLPNLSHSADSAPLRGVSLPDWPQSGSQRSGAAAGQPSAMQPGDHSPAPDTEAHPPSNRQALWNKARPYVTPAAEGLASSLSLASALTSGHVSRITGAMSGLSWVGAATAATATSTATTTPEKIANHALAVATAIDSGIAAPGRQRRCDPVGHRVVDRVGCQRGRQYGATRRKTRSGARSRGRQRGSSGRRCAQSGGRARRWRCQPPDKCRRAGTSRSGDVRRPLACRLRIAKPRELSATQALRRRVTAHGRATS